MRTKTSKPQIPKREALKLAEQALTTPIDTLEEIGEREFHVTSSLNLRWFSSDNVDWHCTLTFAGAWYGSWGQGELGPAVRMAILRAYGVGSEKNWQLREKSFREVRC